MLICTVVQIPDALAHLVEQPSGAKRRELGAAGFYGRMAPYAHTVTCVRGEAP